MSIDLKIQNLCDHVVNWEVGSLGTDLKSVLFSKPIASVASLTVRVNNAVVDRSEYTVKTQEDVVSVDRPFYVVMSRKIKYYQPLIEAQYVTLSTFCRKCRGINYVDDFVYVNDRDILTAKDEELLLQLVEKYVVTKIGSNPFHDWVGTGLHDMVGSKVTDSDLLTSRMREQVTTTIDKLKKVQGQLQATGREVTPGELFGNLISVDVSQGEDPSLFTITVRFTSQRGKQLEYEQLINLSNPRQRISFS
jgi:hypothetical protein